MAKKTKAQVQFEADTTGFTQGIKDADKSLVTLRNELKLNSAELKENGDNVELLSQRQNILQKEQEESASKIEALENKLASAKAIFGENSQEVYKLTNQLIKAKTEFQGIQNDITQTDNKMENLKNGTKQLDSAFSETGQSVEKLGDGFTVAKGVMADLVSNGIQSAKDSLKELAFEGEESMSKFQGQTGLSAQEMSKFRKEMEELYAGNYGESMGDIANAMAEVKQQTKETDPSNIKELTKNAIVLRDTFDMDIQESMRAVNMLTQQFGITGEEAFNLIIQGAQNGLNKNGDLLDSINEYSVHYQQLGFTSEQFFNSLINGTGAGTFSVDKLGDAMKEFGIRSKDTAASTDEGFKLIGLNADKMREKFAQGGETAQQAFDETLTALMSVDDQVKQNQAGIDLFGTMWEDLGMDGVSALSDVSSYTENTNVAIDKTKNSMEELDGVRYDNVSAEIQTIGRQIQTDFITPLLEKLLPPLKSGLSWLKNNLNTLAPIVMNLGIMIGTYFVVGKIMSFIGGVTKLINLVKTGTTVFGALNTVMSLNPIGLIVAAVVGLVAIFVTLWNKCEGFRNFWKGLWDGIKQVFEVVVNAIKIGIQMMILHFQIMWTAIKVAIDLVIGIVQNLWSIISAIFNLIWQVISTIVQKIWNVISTYFNMVYTVVSTILQTIWSIVSTIFNSIWQVISTVCNTIWNFISGIWQSIFSVISVVVNAIWGVISNIFNTIWGFISSIMSSIWGVISNIWNGISGTVFGVINGIHNAISNVFNGIKNTISTVFNSIKTIVSNVWNGIKNAIMTPINTAKDLIGKAIDKIKGFFNFKIKWPKIKLPHFKIDGSFNPVDWLSKGIPKIKVDWYAEGGIFTKPTIFNTSNGLKGIGEAGAETVLPVEKLETWINNAMQHNNLQMINANNQNFEKLVEIGEQLLSKDSNMYVDGRKVSQALANTNDNVSGELIDLKDRGLIL